MRDLDQLRERDDAAGRKLGLFALAGTLTVATLIGFGVLQGGSNDAPAPELDPLSQWALEAREPPPTSAPAAGSAASPSELARLSFPAVLVGDEAAIEATVRAAEAEHAALTGQRVSRPEPRTSARAEDIPASSLAEEQLERLQRAAKHDPLMAQAMPERARASAPHGTDGAFMLQVVSYETRAAAERFASALRARGHKAYVTQAEVPGRSRYFRVRVGPFTTRRDALAYQQAFEESERMHTILVSGAAN